MKQRVSSMMARLYDYWSPHIEEEEISFYRQAIEEVGGQEPGCKVLELACAGGRLLLPFLQEGYDIEGVDSSKLMLDLLRAKAQKANLTPTLYHQRLENLDLKKTYRLIYITLGSFQFVSDLEEAKMLLSKCWRLLEDGGKLIVAFFLPWSELPLHSDGWRIVGDVTDRKRKARFIRREKTAHDPVEQLIETQVRFEMWQGKDLLEMEEKHLLMRWYSKGECFALLRDAGFTNIKMQRSYNPDAPARPSFMLFIATK